MVKRTSSNYSSWACDTRHSYGSCIADKNGRNHVSSNTGWICAPCTYDMCLDCAKVSLYIGNVKDLFKNEMVELFGKKEVYISYNEASNNTEFFAFGDSRGGRLGNGMTSSV